MTISFIAGPMGCGKSTMLLQDYHNAGGGLVLTGSKDPEVRSRPLGRSIPAASVRDIRDLSVPLAGKPKYVFVDEAQFLTAGAVKAIIRYADKFHAIARFYGLVSDFRGNPFTGSSHIIALADEFVMLPSLIQCRCGGRAIINARIALGEVTTSGPQVVEGDIDKSEIYYEPLCRRCWRAAGAQDDPKT